MRQRISWKRRLARFYALMYARDAHRRLILLYHSVDGGPQATASDAFRDHIAVVAAMGQLLPLQQVLSSAPNGKIAIAITFDDGYATLKDHAAELLMEFGGTATAFLNVGQIGDKERRLSSAADGYYPDEQFLTWLDVDALLALGWQIGSHGVRHLDLVGTDAATAKSELFTSKQQIEGRLGKTCDMFAYPWGRNSPELRAEVRAAGYRYGFAGDHAPVTAQSDPLALPRINVAKDYVRDDLAAILRGDWDYLYWISQAKAVMG